MTPKPHILQVRPINGAWEILCPPGPLAQFLLTNSGMFAQAQNNGMRLIIPLTDDLDRLIAETIDTLTDLRYQTGKVQLELWGDL